ncbi:MAG TPA: hypothetical protein VN841_17060 [Bryobacteraceae bacterium]|nr:hypothetical protein [Bryobacteraceae bacterium]
MTEQEVAAFEKQELNNVDADRRDGGGDTDLNRATTNSGATAAA